MKEESAEDLPHDFPQNPLRWEKNTMWKLKRPAVEAKALRESRDLYASFQMPNPVSMCG